MSSRASSPQPDITRSPACSVLSLRTPSTASPSMAVAFQSSGPSALRDATYLRIGFSTSAREAAVVAREDHRLGAEPVGDGEGAAVRQLSLRLRTGGHD